MSKSPKFEIAIIYCLTLSVVLRARVTKRPMSGALASWCQDEDTDQMKRYRKVCGGISHTLNILVISALAQAGGKNRNGLEGQACQWGFSMSFAAGIST